MTGDFSRESGPLAGLDWSFHHVGVACTDLDDEADRLTMVGYRAEGTDFTDPVQGIHCRFMVGIGPRLELIAALPERSVLKPWLRAGVKMYHLAFEVSDIASAIALLVDRRAQLVTSPVPAVAFGGRSIAFLMLPNMMLIELIELVQGAGSGAGESRRE